MKLDFKTRPLSWSSISQFRDYSKEEWYDKYILGKRTPENAAMSFGKLVGGRLEREPNYLPEIVRPEGGIFEYELRFSLGDVDIIGFVDFYHKEKKLLSEYKTGKAW